MPSRKQNSVVSIALVLARPVSVFAPAPISPPNQALSTRVYARVQSCPLSLDGCGWVLIVCAWCEWRVCKTVKTIREAIYGAELGDLGVPKQGPKGQPFDAKKFDAELEEVRKASQAVRRAREKRWWGGRRIY